MSNNKDNPLDPNDPEFKEIMEGFSEFMKTLKELHGNEHLIARIEGAEIMEQAVKGDMFV